ncbi:MAG: hypothetical protein ABS57_19980 [Mesorhizobium sp. SCN 65-12]|nr:MAG: hypothetical protein ABS57_19980 [Mesorhizobium sp. SCN 65-12]
MRIAERRHPPKQSAKFVTNDVAGSDDRQNAAQHEIVGLILCTADQISGCAVFGDDPMHRFVVAQFVCWLEEARIEREIYRTFICRA